jgi:pro-apoptotic serine protease NMA111
MVRKIDSGHLGGLQEGDVILTLNGTLITRVSDLDIMYNNDVLDALIVRKREEIRIKVPTVPTEDLETDRGVVFCGAMLHRPHHAVRQQISKVHSDVYVSGRVCVGSFVPSSSTPLHFRRFLWANYRSRFEALPRTLTASHPPIS